ncbi:MAG TPA: hypothetical protein VF135_00375 [Terriglobales bacterium]
MPKVLRVSFVLIVCLAGTALHAAGKWDTQIFELTRKIAGLAGPGTISLEVRNVSSLSQDDVSAIRRSLQDQLRASGMPTRDNVSPLVRVTLSENLHGLLWIAEVVRGTDTKIAMVSIPMLETASGASSPMLLRRTLIITQQEQILDVAAWQKHDERFLVVLSPSQVSILRGDGSRWEPVSAIGIPHAVYPRDMRGRLWMGRDGDWKAFLPGIQCSGAQQLQPPMTCQNSDDPWWLTGTYSAFYNAARNNYTGVIVPPLSRQLPNFYIATQMRQGNVDSWIFNTTDGLYMIFDGSITRALGGSRDWGSDAAGVRSGCGTGMQLLATGAGDDSGSDTLRAYEIGDRDARPVSPPLAFDGSVTALWTTTEGDSAIAVNRRQTGGYEAYSVSVACNQ